MARLVTRFGKIKNTASRSAIAVMMAAVLAGSATAQQQDGRGQKVESGVSRILFPYYANGVPYGEAHRLGHEAVSSLAEVLRREEMKPHWKNAVQILNFVGAPEAFPILREFIVDRFRGELDHDTRRAISAALVTMGPLARISPSAFRFLVDGSNPDSWRDIEWTFETLKGDARNLDLSRKCITALASSGTEQADSVLTEMIRVGAQNSHWPDLRGLVVEVQTINREIIKEGFENYRRRIDEFYAKGGGKKRG